MVFYNKLLAKWLLNKKKKHYLRVGGLFFTRHRYLEVWEDMELRIRARQYWECVSLMLLPSLLLSLLFSWWWMLLPFLTYSILYWLERTFRSHSVFIWEAVEHCDDTLYLRKRKSYAWIRWYGKKVLPVSEWYD